MRTSVKHLMMSVLLVGGLMIAVPASAQTSGRHRSAAGATTSRSSHENRSTERRSESVRTERRSESPRVESRSADTRRTESVRTERRSADTRRSDGNTQGSVRNGRERPSAAMGGSQSGRVQTERTRTTMERRGSDRNGTGSVDRNRDGNRGGGNNGNSGSNVDNNRNRGGSGNSGDNRGNFDRNRDRGGSNYGSDRNRGGSDRNRDRGGSNYGNDRNRDRGGNNYSSDRNRGGSDRNRGGYDRNRGSGDRTHHGPGRPYNYDRHPHRDNFRHNYAHHNWTRPLPPPHRDWRPVRLRYYRPVVPVHYRPYYGAPVIDRILGITFGTLFNVSLDYLYSNGYYIDGYDADIVYLRDVSMLNVLWPDVMLSYDAGRLANAQFVYATGYNDRTRYNRIYHDLCGVYGPPVNVDAGIATWFGGNTTGWVTLSLGTSSGRYLTTLSIGY